MRRLAQFIEESLYGGTQWVVFEPNDERLCAQIRLKIGAFMQNLFRQGAFQAKTPTGPTGYSATRRPRMQNDIDVCVVNILVAFAPRQPAEFMVMKIQQPRWSVQA